MLGQDCGRIVVQRRVTANPRADLTAQAPPMRAIDNDKSLHNKGKKGLKAETCPKRAQSYRRVKAAKTPMSLHGFIIP